MRYVVGFVFNENLDKVVLMKRSKNPYSGLLNGLGGKIEASETELEAMKREWKEETNTSKSLNFRFLTHVVFESGIELFVYSTFIEENSIQLPYVSNEGVVSWHLIKDVLMNPSNLSEDVASYIQTALPTHML
jgi:8-oxo-dGTP diphosphatase